MMKKFLLLAFVALVSTTMNAQVAGLQKSGKPQSLRALPQTVQMKQETANAFEKAPGRLVKAGTFQYGKQLQLNAADLKPVSRVSAKADKLQKLHKANKNLPANVQLEKSGNSKSLYNNPSLKQVIAPWSLKAANRFASVAPKKAGQLQVQYTGHGLDYYYDGNNETETPVEWTMTPGVATNESGAEVNVLIDVVPELDMFKTIAGYENGIPLEYTIDGNTLTIEPQLIASAEDPTEGTIYVWVFGYTEDYSITMTLNEDGSLKTPSGLEIVVGALNTNTFTFNQNTYLGYYQWTEKVKYTFEGQESVVSPFLETYPGAAYDYFNEKDVTWTMTPNAEDEEFSFFIPAPEELVRYFPNGIDVPYTIEGNKVTVEPFYIGLWYEDGGIRYNLTVFGISGESEEDIAYGNIELTLGEDKSLNFTKPTDILLGVFKDVFFDPTMDAFDGSYQYLAEVNFNGETSGGGEDLDITVEETFKGYGTDYESGENVEWTLSKGTLALDKEKLNVFVDLIPEPTDFTSLYPNGVPVEYTQTGNTIIIAPQVIASTRDSYIMVFSGITDDGAIVLTVGEDGSLNTQEGEEIVYGAWAKEEFDPEYETYLGYYSIVENVKYLKEGQNFVPTVEYEPEGLYLHASFSPSFYSYLNNFSIIPAAGEVSFKNYSADPVDQWSWTIETADEEPVAITGSDSDFSFITEAGQTYTPAVLVGSYQGNASAPYKWGLHGVDEETGLPNYEEAYLFAGESAYDFQMSDGTYSTITKANPDFNIAYYGYLGTPDVNTHKDSLSSLILYQGKPSVPLYIEGVNYLVRNFVPKDNFELKCKIQKATRNAAGRLTLGDVIAEADINLDDVYTGESVAQLNWTEFYTEDEFGMSKTLDHLFIEDEFAVVIEGWDNGTFSAYPYGEYDYNKNGMTSTFIKLTGDDAVYWYTTLYSHQFIGFNGATYGYLLTDDDTNIHFDAEGGETTINVKPMLYSVDDDGETPTTRLFLEDDSDEPEWLSIGFANEQYGENGDGTFDLVFQAEALPEGVEGRKAELVFFQEGAKLVVTVSQGTGYDEAVNAVKTTTKANVKYYSLDGREMKQKKGIVVSNGKKFVVR